MLRQALLQSQNPQGNQRIWTPFNLLAQVLGGGLVNIKRAGIAPMPAGVDNLISPTYLTYFGDKDLPGALKKLFNKRGVRPREIDYRTGSPGGSQKGATSLTEKITGIKNPFEKRKGYNVSFKDSYEKIDLINRLDIIKSDEGEIPNDIAPFTKDMVNFRFEVIDTDDFENPNFIIFRAFIDQFDDKFSADHTSYKYNGRGEKFYIYNSFDRKISLNFKIAAQTRHEMRPLYRKLNYLAAQTAPNYGAVQGRIRTPFMRLTVGDYFKRIPGLLTSVNISWNKEYPWEIKNHKKLDKDMKVLPHILDVSISFQPIHSFTPNNAIGTPYIGIDDWLDKGPATNKKDAGIGESRKEESMREKLEEELKKEIDKQNQETQGDAEPKAGDNKFTLWSKEKRQNFGQQMGDAFEDIGDWFEKKFKKGDRSKIDSFTEGQ